MATIQVVLEANLLRAADRVAKKRRVNRSALVREALREYLRKLHYLELETRDRAGYERFPDDTRELAVWENEAKRGPRGDRTGARL